jgi:hypothetical protein
MKKSSLIKYTLMGACLPLFAGCVERQVVYRDRPAPAPVVVEEEAPPPPPEQVEIQTVAPGPMSVWFWAPGAWEWNGRWVWTRGHWIARPHAGAMWYGPHWDHRGGHRVWVHGYWR